MLHNALYRTNYASEMKSSKFESGIFYHADTFEALALIPNASIDMLLVDLPYGTTDCAWDVIIPFEPLWKEYNRVCKENAAMVFTSQNPFTSLLITSNLKNYRYNWVWDKGYVTGFVQAAKMPLKGFEDVVVFYRRLPTYNPQGVVKTKPKILKTTRTAGGKILSVRNKNADKSYETRGLTNYPNGFIKTDKQASGFHPTQKPVALFEYLIRTYTNEGDTVLDNTAGSGTTAIAAMNSNCRWICIEKEADYYRKAVDRVKAHENKLKNPRLFKTESTRRIKS